MDGPFWPHRHHYHCHLRKPTPTISPQPPATTGKFACHLRVGGIFYYLCSNANKQGKYTRGKERVRSCPEIVVEFLTQTPRARLLTLDVATILPVGLVLQR